MSRQNSHISNLEYKWQEKVVKWDSSDGNVGESERYFNHLQTAPEWDENVGSLVSVFTGLLGER